MLPKQRSDPGSGMGPTRYPGTFMLALREAIAEMGWQAERWLGGAVACTDSEGRERVVGLENLYRRARRAKRSDWPGLIVGFLKMSQSGQIDNPPDDLAKVADKLLFRLGPPISANGEGPGLWQQSIDGTPLCVSLVIDYAETMFYVTSKMIEDSGKPGEEWLALARQNLRNLTPPECLDTAHEESGLLQCSVGDAYDSSRAMLLDDLLPESSQHGHLVALPGRDELLVLPITRASLSFLPMLKMVVEQHNKSDLYPISDEVFWIRDGKWHLLPIKLRDGQASMQPPQEFYAILRQVMPDAEVPKDAAPEGEEP